MKTLVRKLLNKIGFEIIRVRQQPPAKANPILLWDEDAQFQSIMAKVSGYTLIGNTRCFMLYQLARHAVHIPGEVAEVGVYKGGSARLLSKVFETSGKSLHLFDTYGGMPKTDPDKDCVKTGDFGDTSLPRVKCYLSDCRNLFYYEGIFPETANSIGDKTFCFVHVDADIYRSVLDSCEFFYPRLERGGVLIFDDYGYLTCPGAKRAVDEFFCRKPEAPCYVPTGQSFVMKV